MFKKVHGVKFKSTMANWPAPKSLGRMSYRNVKVQIEQIFNGHCLMV